jgi:hypothetical protein
VVAYSAIGGSRVGKAIALIVAPVIIVSLVWVTISGIIGD